MKTPPLDFYLLVILLLAVSYAIYKLGSLLLQLTKTIASELRDSRTAAAIADHKRYPYSEAALKEHYKQVKPETKPEAKPEQEQPKDKPRLWVCVARQVQDKNCPTMSVRRYYFIQITEKPKGTNLITGEVALYSNTLQNFVTTDDAEAALLITQLLNEGTLSVKAAPEYLNPN